MVSARNKAQKETKRPHARSVTTQSPPLSKKTWETEDDDNGTVSLPPLQTHPSVYPSPLSLREKRNGDDKKPLQQRGKKKQQVSRWSDVTYLL
jgi:hypothetical protein